MGQPEIKPTDVQLSMARSAYNSYRLAIGEQTKWEELHASAQNAWVLAAVAIQTSHRNATTKKIEEGEIGSIPWSNNKILTIYQMDDFAFMDDCLVLEFSNDYGE